MSLEGTGLLRHAARGVFEADLQRLDKASHTPDHSVPLVSLIQRHSVYCVVVQLCACFLAWILTFAQRIGLKILDRYLTKLNI